MVPSGYPQVRGATACPSNFCRALVSKQAACPRDDAGSARRMDAHAKKSAFRGERMIHAFGGMGTVKYTSRMSGGVMAMAGTTDRRDPFGTGPARYLPQRSSGRRHRGPELARRAAASHRASDTDETLERFAADIADDRTALLNTLAALGVPVRRYKICAVWVAEKVARLKPNGHLGPVPTEQRGGAGDAAPWRAGRGRGMANATRPGRSRQPSRQGAAERADIQGASAVRHPRRTTRARFLQGLPYGKDLPGSET